MNLINKLTQKKKYTQPIVEIMGLNGEDIITSSGEMAEFEFAEKTKKEEKEIKEQPRELTFYEKYPDGLPLKILELIDFKHFGAKLKQEQLLPPSYDRKPIKIEIKDFCGFPRVFLTFKSKTSESYRIVGICRHSVAYSEKMNREISVMEVNPMMMSVWREFAQNVMWAWERGYNYALVSPEKNIGTYKKPRVDEEKINKLKEIEDECQHFSYFKSNLNS